MIISPNETTSANGALVQAQSKIKEAIPQVADAQQSIPSMEEPAVASPLPTSRSSTLDIVSKDHDVRVRDLLDQVMEYSKDHPGLIKNIRLRERTLGVLMPDNGDKVLDAFEEKHGSSQVQVLRNVFDGKVMAIIDKESTIDFNIAESKS